MASFSLNWSYFNVSQIKLKERTNLNKSVSKVPYFESVNSEILKEIASKVRSIGNVDVERSEFI